jgi:aminoglycoside phosphotransferase (APT) family kinase protein
MPDKITLDVSQVATLIQSQFPEYADLPIKPVSPMGWDNLTFHLGDDLLIRMPSAQRYADKVQKEHYWLPRLASHLSLAIPEPIALGKPSAAYPWHWSIYQWIQGQSADSLQLQHAKTLAIALAKFLNELHHAPTNGAPPSGAHNFYRGGDLSVYDSETTSAIAQLKDYVDASAATSVWKRALTSTWDGQALWVHGDLSSGNILINEGKLTAIIDFSGICIGDPSCDLVIAWTYLSKASRTSFKTTLDATMDAETWARARGWALWKALITLVDIKDKSSKTATVQKKIIQAIIEEHAHDTKD